MTEAEWLAAVHPDPMLTFLRGRVSDRKLRLFVTACCWRVAHHFDEDEDWRIDCIVTAEKFADGLIDDEAREDALGEATDGGPHRLWDYCTNLALADFIKRNPEEVDGIECAIGATCEARHDSVGEDYDDEEKIKEDEAVAQTALLREILGPLLFRPVVLDPTWLDASDGLVRNLAQTAYAERLMPSRTLDPDRLAILADALEDAGCTLAELLAHLREPEAHHVRGCWALDLILGHS